MRRPATPCKGQSTEHSSSSKAVLDKYAMNSQTSSHTPKSGLGGLTEEKFDATKMKSVLEVMEKAKKELLRVV